MLARTHLLRIQRGLYHRFKASAKDYFGQLGPELRRYFQEYQQEFQRFGQVASKQELVSRLLESEIAFCGDYHTLRQSQRTVIRLLREILPALRTSGRELVLALELVPRSRTPHVEGFLRGEQTEGELLEGIGFFERWGFNWNNYRELFLFCKDNGVSIQGINGPSRPRSPSLRARDRFAAEIIADLAEAENRLVFVLVGDMHLAASHLPAQVERSLKRRKRRRKTLVIHQNSEKLYWKLVDRGLEHDVDVVRLRKGVYCVMNTPPWVKLQSLVQWGEVVSLGTEGIRQMQKRWLRPKPSEEAFADLFREFEYLDDVRELLAGIQQFLGIEEPVDGDFTVSGPSDLGFLEKLDKEHGFAPRSFRFLIRYLSEFESLFIPHVNVIFLSEYSLNQAAARAAVYLHSKISDFRGQFENPRRDFYSFVWVEALGFLGSKIINHKRKCQGPRDWEERSRRQGREEAQVAALCLKHLRLEWRGELGTSSGSSPFRLPGREASETQVVVFYRAARELGELLGHAIYMAAVAGRVSRAEVRGLFENSFCPPRIAREMYLEWTRRLDAESYRNVRTKESL